MKKFLIFLVLFAASAVASFASTAVSGVGIHDVNGNLYSNGTVSAFIVLATGQPLPAGATLSSGPFSLDGTASFTIALFSPASYQFTICGTPVNLGPRANAAPNSVCFTAGPVAVSGGSQDVSTILNAAAVLLGPLVGSSSGGVPGGAPSQTQVNDLGAFGGTGCQTFPDLAVGPINQDCNVSDKGPNPYFDIMRYGGYFEPVVAPQTSVCSITASSATLSCVSNTSFQNGHGVVIPKAGLLPLTRNASFPAVPTVATVTPTGVSGGSTTYSYQFVLEDYFGGLTAAGTAGSTTAGAATLGINTVPLTGMTRVSQLDTFACSTNCNLMTNAQVQIAGATGSNNSTVNGTVVVNSIVDPTHFTVLANGMPDYSETFSGTLSVKACNELFPSGLLTQESVIMRTWIYRGGTLVGVSPGQDPFYTDCGQGVSGQPAYVPTSAPGAAQAGYLATTISSGGGTTTMTLAASAGTTATSQTVQHSNDAALIAAYTAALAAHGGVLRIPVIPAGGTNTFPFNASTNLSTVSNPTNATVRLELASVTVNQPWILPNFFEMDGIPQVSTSFQYGPLASISGNSHPLILGSGVASASNGVRLSNVKFVTNNATGQSSIVLDQVVGSGGKVGWVFNDVALAGNSAPAIVIKGGFDFWFTRGVCGISDLPVWAGHPCVYLTNASTYLNAAGTQAPGRVYFNQYNLNNGTGIQVDNAPLSNLAGTATSGGGDIFLNQILHESNAGPTLRVALGLSTTSALGREYVLDGVHLSDNANGAHQPVLELTGNADVHNITVSNNQGAAFEPTILGGGTGAAPLCINNLFLQGCGPTPNQNINGVNSVNDGGVIGSTNGGSMGYLMPTPAAPASCVVSAGGSVPVGAFTYAIIAVDRLNISYNPYQGLTLLGPTCSVTTTSGQQTVTVTRPALPAGASGWLPWRGAALAQLPNCGIPIPASTTTYVDTFATACGQSAPQASTAFLAGINSGGINAGSLTLSGNTVTGIQGTGFNLLTTINICTNYPITTLTGTANTVDCPAVGILVLPTSVTTFSNNNYKVACSSTGVVIQRGSGASGLKFTGDKSGVDGCVFDDGAFTSTARLIEVTGNDDFVKNSFFQNHSATSSAFPTIDLTGSATRAVIANNTSTGTQVDPFIAINSASTASGSVDGPKIEGNTIVNFAPTAATTGVGGNQVGGSSVLNVSVQRNFVKSSTANAHNYEFDGQVVVQNAANMNWRYNGNESTAVTAAPAVHMRLFGQYLVSGEGNIVNTGGLASVQGDCNFGDLYNAKIGCVIHGGASENGMNCVDCENSDFDVNVDNVGGGFAAFSGSSASNPFRNNIIRVHAKLGANAVGFQIKGNGSGKPADYNRVTSSEIVCNGNANTTGGLFDIGNSSTGKNNSVDTTTFQGCSGAGSVDLNINNSAMSFTTIGNGVQFDSGDTKTISDSGTNSQFTAPLIGGGIAGKGQIVKKAQTAALTTTTILTTDADAEWRVYLVVDCTTASAAATATPSITYTDTSNTAQTITGSAATCTTLGASSFSSQDLVFNAKAATAIQYAVAIANTPTYDFRLVIERLTTQ